MRQIFAKNKMLKKKNYHALTGESRGPELKNLLDRRWLALKLSRPSLCCCLLIYVSIIDLRYSTKLSSVNGIFGKAWSARSANITLLREWKHNFDGKESDTHPTGWMVLGKKKSGKNCLDISLRRNLKPRWIFERCRLQYGAILIFEIQRFVSQPTGKQHLFQRQPPQWTWLCTRLENLSHSGS